MISRVHVMNKKKNTLRKAVPYSWWKIPILPGPLLGISCLLSPLANLTPAPIFPQTRHLLTVHTDDINTPASPCWAKKQ